MLLFYYGIGVGSVVRAEELLGPGVELVDDSFRYTSEKDESIFLFSFAEFVIPRISDLSTICLEHLRSIQTRDLRVITLDLIPDR